MGITIDEAVGLYTHGAAEAAGCASERGSLDPGKRTDLVILDRKLDASSLDHIEVARTFIGGTDIPRAAANP